ncbi:MAG: pre-peptidase C-terminal domain-containing protein [Herpetosiphonaceae bacterium]|nr:pre-peptidase C-terminal domain-containing protein [Herpetosiphonaceae bacterium]
MRSITLLLIAGMLALPMIAAAQTPTEAPSATLTSVASATATATSTAVPSATTTPTATLAATQTPYVVTATPAATPTANAPQPDAYEPNDTSGTAARIALPALVEKLNFYPAGDIDYFRFSVKASQSGLTLTLDTYAEIGIDTTMRLLSSDGSIIAENDDFSPTDLRSHIAVTSSAGEYSLEIANQAQIRPDFKTYKLALKLIQPPAPDVVPTATPAPEPGGAWDQYNGTNYTWDSAPQIAIGEALEGLTFGCPSWDSERAECAVPDFFRIAVKQGTCYTAATADLAPGVDTNVIVFSDQRDSAAPLTGNDDRARDDFSSSATFCSPYSGDAYLLIGQAGNSAPPPPIKDRTYSFSVNLWSQPEPTSTPLATQPGAQPPSLPAPQPGPGHSEPGLGQVGDDEPLPFIPPPVAPAPTLEPASLQGVIVEEIRPEQLAQPTSAPQVVIPVAVLACYDRNLNQSCDVDEGIAGLTVYVANAASGALLGQAITDQNGRAQLTVRVAETASMNISVPSFAASQTISARSVQIRPIVVKTVAAIPALIP